MIKEVDPSRASQSVRTGSQEVDPWGVGGQVTGAGRPPGVDVAHRITEDSAVIAGVVVLQVQVPLPGQGVHADEVVDLVAVRPVHSPETSTQAHTGQNSQDEDGQLGPKGDLHGADSAPSLIGGISRQTTTFGPAGQSQAKTWPYEHRLAQPKPRRLFAQQSGAA